MSRAVKSMSRARLRPTARTIDTAGEEQKTPRLTPGVPNRAPSSATARSQAATSWQPAAVAIPCTWAITGWGIRWRRSIISAQIENMVLCTVMSLPARSPRSWPAQKFFPAALMMSTFTSRPAAMPARQRFISSSMAMERAFCLAGRLSVMTPTVSVFSYAMFRYSMPLPPCVILRLPRDLLDGCPLMG